MNDHPHKPADNIVQLPIKPRNGSHPADRLGEPAVAPAMAGGHDDPRTQEAMRLVESFLAIEDTSARAALIALAESLVTHDWLRRTQQR
jgi:hypothetical protein